MLDAYGGLFHAAELVEIVDDAVRLPVQLQGGFVINAIESAGGTN